MRSPLCFAAACVLVFQTLLRDVMAFSPEDNSSSKPAAISRRDLFWKAPLGAVATYAYGRLAVNAFSVQGIKYPAAHEERLESILTTSLLAAGSPTATSPTSSTTNRAYRILEIGIGNCRIIRRGLYKAGLDQLAAQKGNIRRVEVTGVDLELPQPSAVDEARRILQSSASASLKQIDLSVHVGDITQKLPYPDGYFDSILCCLTLCSVSNQVPALEETKRLLRPDGGTFAYLEHVAVSPEEKSERSFLEFQQRLLDPLQQVVADNCHLHRYTEDAILSAFDINTTTSLGKAAARASRLEHERFYVDSMWPVSCQCCGVIQRTLA